MYSNDWQLHVQQLRLTYGTHGKLIIVALTDREKYLLELDAEVRKCPSLCANFIVSI